MCNYRRFRPAIDVTTNPETRVRAHVFSCSVLAWNNRNDVRRVFGRRCIVNVKRKTNKKMCAREAIRARPDPRGRDYGLAHLWPPTSVTHQTSAYFWTCARCSREIAVFENVKYDLLSFGSVLAFPFLSSRCGTVENFVALGAVLDNCTDAKRNFFNVFTNASQCRDGNSEKCPVVGRPFRRYVDFIRRYTPICDCFLTPYAMSAVSSPQ